MSKVADGFPKLDKDTRPWVCKWENSECRRKNPCPRCLGARNRRKGLRKQRAVAKEIQNLSGAPVGRYSTQTGNEENWRGPFRSEAKAGKQVQRTATLYVEARAQAEAARPHGDGRPFMMAAIPDGWPDGEFLWIVHSADLPAVIEGLIS